eukprot:m.150348 g.150348  ORF g.150348 m.150348 type:complete len:487 (-) comp17377_c0_seq2:87-1547(-)
MRVVVGLCLLAVVLTTRQARGVLQCSAVHPLPPMKLFSQPVNHNDPSGPHFNQQIQVIDENYKPGGPVLFYAGPENAASTYTLVCLRLVAWAKQLNGAVVGVEHRYFGASVPANKTSWDPLTLDNVLQDYTAVAKSMVAPKGPFKGAKIISFGGSYGGFLSAMLRIRYPDVFFASVASAAPVYLYGSNIANGTWYDTVAAIYQEQDATCAGALSASFQDVVSMLDQELYTSVQGQLGLCRAPSQYTAKSLLTYLQHAAQVVAQFNYPFPSAAKVPFPFQAACASFSSEPALVALRNLLDLGYNSTRHPVTCFWPGTQQQGRQGQQAELLHVPYALHQAASLIAGQHLHDINFAESWFYITCSYFVMPIAGGDAATLFFHFQHTFSYDVLASYCHQRFGVTPSAVPAVTISEVESSSRVIFSNMAFDPVKGFSIQKNISSSVWLLDIADAGHTQDIIAQDTKDPQAVLQARDRELKQLQLWLDGAQH